MYRKRTNVTSEEPGSIDEWVDWEMTESPAAEAQKKPLTPFDLGRHWLARPKVQPPEDQ